MKYAAILGTALHFRAAAAGAWYNLLVKNIRAIAARRAAELAEADASLRIENMRRPLPDPVIDAFTRGDLTIDQAVAAIKRECAVAASAPQHKRELSR